MRRIVLSDVAGFSLVQSWPTIFLPDLRHNQMGVFNFPELTI
jgi:hypothetical protein